MTTLTLDDIRSKYNLLSEVQSLVSQRFPGQQRGTEWRNTSSHLLCPFHSHRDFTPSLTVNPYKGVWHCFGGSCGRGGGIIDWLGYTELPGEWMGKATPSHTFRRLIEILGGGVRAPQAAVELPPEPPKAELTYHNISLWQDNLWCMARNSFIVDWLKGRGINPKWGQSFGLGFTGDDPRLKSAYDVKWLNHKLVIPWFAEGEVVGIKVRSHPKQKKSYFAFPGSDFAGLHNQDCLFLMSSSRSRTIFLQETELDNIALCSYLDEDCGIAQSAMKFGPEHARLLMGKRLVNIRDNDEAGEKTLRAIQAIMPRVISATPPEAKDLGAYIELGHEPTFLHSLKGRS